MRAAPAVLRGGAGASSAGRSMKRSRTRSMNRKQKWAVVVKDKGRSSVRLTLWVR